MENDREKKAEERLKDLDNLDVAEIDDKDLEDASGGASSGSNFNCGCGPS